MKRYDFFIGTLGAKPCKEGQWVKWDSVKRLMNKLCKRYISDYDACLKCPIKKECK